MQSPVSSAAIATYIECLNTPETLRVVRNSTISSSEENRSRAQGSLSDAQRLRNTSRSETSHTCPSVPALQKRRHTATGSFHRFLLATPSNSERRRTMNCRNIRKYDLIIRVLGKSDLIQAADAKISRYVTRQSLHVQLCTENTGQIKISPSFVTAWKVDREGSRRCSQASLKHTTNLSLKSEQRYTTVRSMPKRSITSPTISKRKAHPTAETHFSHSTTVHPTIDRTTPPGEST